MTFTEAEDDSSPASPVATWPRSGPTGPLRSSRWASPTTRRSAPSTSPGSTWPGSAKYRNVRANPKWPSSSTRSPRQSMEGAHFLEIRGIAETAVGTHDPQGHLAPEIIRIHPRRILSFNVDPEHPGFAARDVAPADPGTRWPDMRAVEVARFGGPEVLDCTRAARSRPGPGPGRRGHVGLRRPLRRHHDPIRPGRRLLPDPAALRPRQWRRRHGDGHRRRRRPQLAGPRGGGAHRRAGGTGGYAELAAVDLDDCAAVPEGSTSSMPPPCSTTAPPRCASWRRPSPARGSGPSSSAPPAAWGFFSSSCWSARGAQVIGAARGRTKRDVVSEAGAHAAIDYGEAGWTELSSTPTGGRRPTLVLDGVGGRLGGEAFGLIADGGRFSAHGTPSGSFAPIDPGEARATGRGRDHHRRPPVRGRRPRPAPRCHPDRGRGRPGHPPVGQVMPLAEASKAHWRSKQRETLAKTLLVPDLR